LVNSVNMIKLDYVKFMNGVMAAPRQYGSCLHCGGLGLKADMCCSGYECGCRGLPIDFVDCGCGATPPSDRTILKWLRRSRKEHPNMYAPVWMRFNSLRTQVNPETLGVRPDCDELVVRQCRRVLTPSGGWKWQIVKIRDQEKWDWVLEVDQGILDEHGESLEYEIVLKS